MKRLLSTLVLITLALGAFDTRHIGASAQAAAATVPLAERGGAQLRFVPGQIREANRRLRYTIKARYPQVRGARDARMTRLNEEIRNLIVREVNGFKKDFQRPQERMGAGGGSYFDTVYSVELATADLVSIGFGVSSFYEGAAHPQHNTLVFNYDLKSEKRLRLSDLFKPGSNYLTVVSDYAIAALKKELSPDPDLDWIKNGAGPTEENYKNWNLTRAGLKVTFDPYQVASYAEGEHIVLIPYGALKNVIDPAGPLARITSGHR